MANRSSGFEWGQSAGMVPQSYNDWTEYEQQRLGKMTGHVERQLINPEQYQNYQARQKQFASRMGGGLAQAGAQAAAVADPWASQRGQYQTMLSQLTQNPGSAMQNNPFFKWQQDQGLEAVNRKMAASGGRVSGNRMMALSDYAQNQSGQNFFQLADLYALLGGARNQNPAAAAALQYEAARDEQVMPLNWYQADVGMTSANNPRYMQDQAKKGYQDAIREQQIAKVNRQLSAF